MSFIECKKYDITTKIFQNSPKTGPAPPRPAPPRPAPPRPAPPRPAPPQIFIETQANSGKYGAEITNFSNFAIGMKQHALFAKVQFVPFNQILEFYYFQKVLSGNFVFIV